MSYIFEIYNPKSILRLGANYKIYTNPAYYRSLLNYFLLRKWRWQFSLPSMLFDHWLNIIEKLKIYLCFFSIQEYRSNIIEKLKIYLYFFFHSGIQIHDVVNEERNVDARVTSPTANLWIFQ